MKRNINQRVGYHIGIVAHVIQNNHNQKLAEYDLTVSQTKVLFMLVNYGDQLQSELQNRLYIKASTMNGIIDTLLKKQLITKKDNDLDRRSKIINLTEKGKALEEKLWLEAEDIDRELMHQFSNEEKQLLLSMLKRIKTNVNNTETLCRKERN